MALFKVKKGLAANLPQTYNEGWAYFTTDDGKFYIDTSNDASGRKILNPDAIVNLEIDGSIINFTKNNGISGSIDLDNYEEITEAEIDEICGQSLVDIREVYW